MSTYSPEEQARQTKRSYERFAQTADELARERIDITFSLMAQARVLGEVIAQLPEHYHATVVARCGEIVSEAVARMVAEGESGKAIEVTTSGKID
jgi:hypothetical protein